MLFINPIHLIISVAFSSSVTPCFFAISLSDIPPYSKRFRRIPTIKDVMYSLTCDADIMTKITEDT